MIDKSIATTWLKDKGYKVPDTGMDSYINLWWEWFCSTTAFYDSTNLAADGKTYKVERITMNLAKMLCEDWAGVLFNDETVVNFAGVTDADDDADIEATLDYTNDWLQGWIRNSGLFENSSPLERAFGLGTAGWALGLQDINEDGTINPEASVILQWYDARSIIPLNWDNSGVTIAAFLLPVVIDGEELTQVTLHSPDENGFYTIQTGFLKDGGKQVNIDGYTTVLNTHSTTPTFALFSPAIDNTYVSHSPLGMSIIDRCIGTIKIADGAFDNLWKDLFLGQKMLMLSESMLEQDENGAYIVPRAQSQQLFMKMESDSIEQNEMIHEYNPDLRVEDNRSAINTGLSLLGKRAGFGLEYYELDKSGTAAKTAKEVAASNAELLRNAKKHEQNIEPAIVQICEAAIELAREYIDPSLVSVQGMLSVHFGDTIVEDDSAERENDRADVAAGLLPRYRYIMKYHGVDEETAKAWCEPDVNDAMPQSRFPIEDYPTE